MKDEASKKPGRRRRSRVQRLRKMHRSGLAPPAGSRWSAFFQVARGAPGASAARSHWTWAARAPLGVVAQS